MVEREARERWIEIDSFDGRHFDAYLALPPATLVGTPTPGIVLLQEIWGVNDHIRAVARQYASDGFVVLAPDMFWRMQPRVELAYDDSGTKQAYAYRKGIDLDLADRDIASTAAHLRAMPHVAGGIAAIGYCMGGLLAYRAAGAATAAGIQCAVAYYGGGIHTQLAIAASIDIPIAFHFGEKDPHIAKDAVDAVKAVFGTRANARIDTYPDAGHGFNCWARPGYHQNAAALAHGRSLAFLATHLR